MRGAAAVTGAIAALVLSSCVAATPEFDLIVRGGMLLDGTGVPAMRADVGVKGDRIAVIGDLTGRSATTLPLAAAAARSASAAARAFSLAVRAACCCSMRFRAAMTRFASR